MIGGHSPENLGPTGSTSESLGLQDTIATADFGLKGCQGDSDIVVLKPQSATCLYHQPSVGGLWQEAHSN